MSLISPSRLTIEAAGLSPVSTHKAAHAGICAMCGYPYQAGDPVLAFRPESSFTDYGALRGQGNKAIDGWCAATWTREFTQTHGKAVVSRQGVFKAASNNDIAWWLLNPPEGPWLFVQMDQQVQHLFWRAPVNYSRDVFFIQYGEARLTVRRENLARGADAARRLAIVASEGRKGAALKHPFVRLARELDEPLHGLLRPNLYKIANDRVEVGADIDIVAGLTSGELWGLTAVLYATESAVPERKLPELVA
ncbi:type IV CRISPR-associated protein Csf1 [Paraburkholderia youngii]|uniref:type IV CRISPR-associated protein Csf1 n=1 Tax=Paraburkholderia youngii TaxID=2782701 RepID=UPI003D2317B7